MSVNIEVYEIAIQAAREAGRAILEIYHSADFKVEVKVDDSPLTKADKKAHAIIEHHLSKTGIRILSEEGRDIPYSERKTWDTFWMVDPLDGTKEFIKKNGEFTVNIALIEYGKPTFGVVYVPVTDTMYCGGEKYRPTKIDATGMKEYLTMNPYESLASVMSLPHLHVFGSRTHMNEETVLFTSQLDNPTIQAMGSSLKFMKIADKEANLYPRFAPTMEWDTAAAHAILLSLGHHIIEPSSNQELVYNKQNLLNPYFICY